MSFLIGFRKRRLLVFFTLFLTGCGFHLDTHDRLPSLSLACVEGDLEGYFTSALIQQFRQVGIPVKPSATWVLQIDLVKPSQNHIGFQYDVNGQGELTNYVIPSETQLTVSADVSIKDCQDNLILGPCRVSASWVFDHTWYTPQNEINVFSLGQFTDYADAKDQAIPLVYRKLAGNIAHWVEVNLK